MLSLPFVWLILEIPVLHATINEASPNQTLPCDFLDSYNITDGIRHENGSISFEGVNYPSDLYAAVNYQVVLGRNKSFEPYVRGCLCKIRNCIRFCCAKNQYYDRDTRSCYNHEVNENIKSEFTYDEKNKELKILFDRDFSYVSGDPCHYDYKFYVEDYEILDNGDIRTEKNIYSQQRYCLGLSYNKTSNIPILQAFTCVKRNIDTRTRLLTYGMLVSVPFLLTTFLVYLLVPDLRNIPGKCLLSYLMVLAIKHLLSAVMLLNTKHIEPIPCKIIGHVLYFLIISSFLWLNVISFDAYSAFTTFNSNRSKPKRFTLYMVYAWGLSILLTGMIYALDSSEWLPDYLKPGVGTITCFLNRKHRLAQFLYYFLPMYILIILNTGFFVVAAIKIRSIQNDVNRMGSKEAGSQERTKRQKDIENFVLFFRLFVVMGMGWLEEPISYLIPGNSHWFIIVEIFNVLIGVWIFILFVLKRRVLQLIRNRLHKSTAVDGTVSKGGFAEVPPRKEMMDFLM